MAAVAVTAAAWGWAVAPQAGLKLRQSKDLLVVPRTCRPRVLDGLSVF